jgi:hypothetical protein
MSNSNFEIGDVLFQSLLDYYDNKAYQVKDILITNGYKSEKYNNEFVKIYILEPFNSEKSNKAYKFVLDNHCVFDYYVVNELVGKKVFIPSKNLYGKILNVLIATKADSISGSPTENKPVYEFGYKVAGLDKEYYYLAPSEIKLIEDKKDKKYKTITETKVFKQFNLKEIDKLINEVLFSSKDDYVERDENKNQNQNNNVNDINNDTDDDTDDEDVIDVLDYWGNEINTNTKDITKLLSAIYALLKQIDRKI